MRDRTKEFVVICIEEPSKPSLRKVCHDLYFLRLPNKDIFLDEVGELPPAAQVRLLLENWKIL